MKNKLPKIQNLIKRILSNKFATDLIYSLPIFHIAKGHQENIQPHKYFLNNNNKANINKIFIKIKNYLLNFFFEDKIFYKKNIKETQYDVFLLSNIIAEGEIKEDYVFGNLADDLNRNNIKTLTIFRNFTNLKSKDLKISLKTSNIILSKTINLFTEITFWYNIYIVSKSINLLKKKIKNKKIEKFLNYVNKIKHLMPIVGNLRLYFQISKLIKKYKPKTIVFTFENHGWERFLIKKIKTDNKEIKIVGYQFTTITKNQYSRYSKKNFDPDFILSSGQETFKYLKKIFKNKVKVINFGSYRNIKLIKKKNKRFNSNFLLLPESPISEVNDFVNVAIDLCKKYKDSKFTLRLHPMSKSKKIMKRINQETKNLNNFVLSSKSLDSDLNENFFIIHRASSLSITAGLRGLLPIYLNNHSFNLNPLFIVNKKYILSSDHDLTKIFSYNKQENLVYQKKVVNFCKKYFEKPKHRENLKLFNYFNQTMI